MRVHRHPRVPVKFATRVSQNKPRLRDILHTDRHETAKEGDRAPLFPDAYTKCRCGCTCRTELDFRLHTNNSGVCLVMVSGQKPRIDRIQAAAPEADIRRNNP